jgi:hypothetical protein
VDGDRAMLQLSAGRSHLPGYPRSPHIGIVEVLGGRRDPLHLLHFAHNFCAKVGNCLTDSKCVRFEIRLGDSDRVTDDDISSSDILRSDSGRPPNENHRQSQANNDTSESPRGPPQSTRAIPLPHQTHEHIREPGGQLFITKNNPTLRNFLDLAYFFPFFKLDALFYFIACEPLVEHSKVVTSGLVAT